MDIQLFIVPYDSGHLRWRCGGGPEHLLRAGLTVHLHRQGHLVRDIHVLEDDPASKPAEIRTAFELARRLAAAVRRAHAAGHFSLVLGGNCNTAIGTLSGLAPTAEPPSGSMLTGITTRLSRPRRVSWMGWVSP
jgi:arginase family enzyme